MFRRLPARFATLTTLTLLAMGGPAAESTAANREHQQLMADIRMLQEQTQQLQVTLNALAEALKLVTTRIDDQGNASRKALADQKLQADTLAGDVRVVREKLDETNVRLSSLSQELEAMRISATAPPPTVPATSEDPNALPAVDPGAAPAPAPPAAAGLSPQRLYDTAYADFASGQWTLAIQGFETYIKTFPRTEQADDAQLYIGEAYVLDEKLEQAIAAYDKVIANYPAGDAVSIAYYKRGLALVRIGQNAKDPSERQQALNRARESWQTVITKFPDSDASRLAKQGLDRLARSKE